MEYCSLVISQRLFLVSRGVVFGIYATTIGFDSMTSSMDDLLDIAYLHLRCTVKHVRQ